MAISTHESLTKQSTYSLVNDRSVVSLGLDQIRGENDSQTLTHMRHSAWPMSGRTTDVERVGSGPTVGRVEGCVWGR